MPQPLEQLGDLRRLAPPNATFACTVMCGNSAYSWNTSPTERRSGGRSMPRSVSSHTSSPSAIRPRAGRRSPATARRIVVLPAPDGPTSATVSAPTRQAGS